MFVLDRLQNFTATSRESFRKWLPVSARLFTWEVLNAFQVCQLVQASNIS